MIKMKKSSIKITGALILLIAILTTGIALVGPYFISDQTLKVLMGQYLESLLDRKVTFGGEISLRLLPRPTLRTEMVRISDWDDPQKRPLLEIDRIQSSIQIIPLLRNEIVLNELFANGVRAAIAVDGDAAGLMKIGDHLDKLQTTSSATMEIGIRSDVEKVIVSNATVSLIDKDGGDIFEMKNLSFKLKGKTDKQVSLTFEFADDTLEHSAVCGCRGKFRMEGRMQARLGAGQFRLISSKIESEATLHGENHQSIQSNIRLELAADSTDGSFRVDNLDAAFGDIEIRGDIRGNYLAENRQGSGALSLKAASLAKAIEFFRPQEISGLAGPMETKFGFSFNNDGIILDPFTLGYAKNQIDGRMAYHFSDPPVLEIALDSDLLDLASLRQYSAAKAHDIPESPTGERDAFWGDLLSVLRNNNADIRFSAGMIQDEKPLAKNVHFAISSKDGKIHGRDISAQFPNGRLTCQVQGDIEENTFQFDVKTTVSATNRKDDNRNGVDSVVVADGRLSGNRKTFSGVATVERFSLNRLLEIFNLSLPAALRRDLFDDVAATIEIAGDQNGLLQKNALIHIKDQKFQIRKSRPQKENGRNEVMVSADTINLDQYLLNSWDPDAARESGDASDDLAGMFQHLPNLQMTIQANRLIMKGIAFQKGYFVLSTKTNMLEIQSYILHLKNSRLEGFLKAESDNSQVRISSLSTYKGKLVDLKIWKPADNWWLTKTGSVTVDLHSNGADMDAIKKNLSVKMTGKLPAQKQKPGTRQDPETIAGLPDLEKLDHTIEIELVRDGDSPEKSKKPGGFRFHMKGTGNDRSGRKRLVLTADGSLQAWGAGGKIVLGKTPFLVILTGEGPEGAIDRYSAGGKIHGDTRSRGWFVEDLALAAPGFTASGYFAANISPEKGFSGKGEVDVPPFNPSRLLERMGFGFYRRSDPETYQNARMKSHIEADENGFQFTDLSLSVDQTTLLGSVRLAGFHKPFIKVDLSGDDLNLDRYLPDSPKDEEDQNSPEPEEDFFLQGHLKFARFSVIDIEIKNLETGISLTPRKLKCEPFSTRLAGGQAKGVYRMDFGSKKSTAFLEVDARSFRAEEVLRYLTGKEEKLTGEADVGLAMSWTVGGGYDGFARTVTGNAKLGLTNGKLKKEQRESVAMAASMAEEYLPENAERNAERAKDEWPYTKGSVNYSAQNGIIQSDDTAVDLRDGTIIRGRGKINLATSGVHYRFDVNLPGNIYPVIPFDVTGYYPDVDVKVNSAALTKSSVEGVLTIPGTLVRETVEGGKKILSGSKGAIDYIGDGFKELFTW